MLGVRPQASTEEIRSAYRRLLRAVHPDVGGTAALFDEVRHAYEILDNPSRRRAYDTELTTAPPRPWKPPVRLAAQRHFAPQEPDRWWRRALGHRRAYAVIGTLAVIVGAAVILAVIMAPGRGTPGTGTTTERDATVTTPQPTGTRLRAGRPVHLRGRVLTVTADRTTFRLQPVTGAAVIVRITDRTRFGTARRPTTVTSVAQGAHVWLLAGMADGYVVAWRVIPQQVSPGQASRHLAADTFRRPARSPTADPN